MVRKNDLKRKFSLQKETNKIQIKYKLMTLPENKNLICQLKKSLESEELSKIASKPLHGKFFKHLEGAHINKELSVEWLANGRRQKVYWLQHKIRHSTPDTIKDISLVS